jgi:arginyl-tRNA--protein-N-Asp/Glu arginylyltransferase
MRDFRHPPRCKLELPLFICWHDELASHLCNKLDRLPFAMYGYHIDACSDLRTKLEYLNVTLDSLHIHVSGWTVFLSTEGWIAFICVYEPQLLPYLYVSLDCLHINVSVWVVFTTACMELDYLGYYISSCTVIVSTYQAACLPTYISE